MSEEQTKQLERVLRPVAARLYARAWRPLLVRSIFLGAALALVPALLRLATGNLLWQLAGFAALLALPIFMLVRAFAGRLNLRQAALAVDQHYAWQDRVGTAWASLSVGGLTP